LFLGSPLAHFKHLRIDVKHSDMALHLLWGLLLLLLPWCLLAGHLLLLLLLCCSYGS
jgi:hypothetical protein